LNNIIQKITLGKLGLVKVSLIERYFDNIITIYMATKKQKIRKRKTFRGGSAMKRKSNSQSQPEPGLGLSSAENVFRFLNGIKRIKGNGSQYNKSSRAAEISLVEWTNARTNMEKRVENAKIEEKKKRVKLPTVAEQAAENEEKPHINAKTGVRLKEAIEKVAGSFTDRGNANKRQLEWYKKKVKDSEDVTRVKQEEISDLKERLGVLKNSLPSSALQSALSFLRRTPTASIQSEIDSITKKLAIEEPYLEELKIQLQLNKKDLQSFQIHQNLMKKPKL